MGNAISPRGDMPKHRVRSNSRTHHVVDHPRLYRSRRRRGFPGGAIFGRRAGASIPERSISRLAEGREPELRRSRRPDRGHASHPGRGEALDLGEPFPARAQLLHVVAWPRGAAARYLYRLADAPHARRHHGRGPFRRARHHRHHGAQLRLRGLRQRAFDRRAVLRLEGSGAGHRARGRIPKSASVHSRTT